MSYTKETLEKNKVRFTFDAESDEWQKAITEAYDKTKNKYQIGGFRKGHAPRKVIESMYGVGVFFDDALDIILPKYYEAALDENPDVFPVDRPEIGIKAISDATLEFTVEVQCKPDVKLGAYSGLEFKKDKVKVTKEEIKAQADKALDQASTWESVDGRPAALGDRVVIDYSGSVDGVKFDGGTAEGASLDLGSGQFIPGFEDGVVGMNAGESKDVAVTFPEEYGKDDLAGKAAIFAVTLHKITVKTTPAYDDEFVKDVSEFDNVKDYEKSIKDNIAKRQEAEAERKLEDDIVAKIAENTEVEVPECMVEQRAEDMVERFAYQLSGQGLNIEDYFKFTQETRETLMAKYHDSAATDVKKQLVLEAIVKELSIPVDDADVEAVIAQIAEEQGAPVDELRKSLGEENMSYVHSKIITDKLFEYLKNNNTIL